MARSQARKISQNFYVFLEMHSVMWHTSSHRQHTKRNDLGKRYEADSQQDAEAGPALRSDAEGAPVDQANDESSEGIP